MRRSTRNHGFLRRAFLPVAALAVIASLGTARSARAVACSTSPVISSVTPAFGPTTGGTAVVIAGTGFCSTNLKVWFGASKVTNANISFISSTEIDVNTPANGAVGPVTVRVQQQTSAKGKQFRLVNGFTYTCVACTVSPVSLQFEGVDTVQQTTEANGVLEPGESSVVIKPTVLNSSGSLENPVTGAITNFTGPQNGAADIVYTVNDSAAAYGSIASGATADCGSNCYAVTVTIGGSGLRPTINTTADIDWDATMEETPTTTVGPTTAAQAPYDWRVHVGNTFTDEPKTDLFYDYVERLVHNHVTFGVGGGLFQPGANAPRNQMAAFISRAFAGGDANVPDTGTISSGENPIVNGSYDCSNGGTSLFSDVPPTDTFCKHIHYIAKLNVTSGDGSGHYNPTGIVSRAVMSVFISRALVPGLGDDGVPDSGTGTGSLSGRTYDCTNGPAPFTDVPLGGTCKNIGSIWILGVVDGNGDGTFSPNANVTRGQMSKFLDNAFQLTIGPAQ